MSRLTWKRSLRSFDSSWMETLKSASSLRISSKNSALLPGRVPIFSQTNEFAQEFTTKTRAAIREAQSTNEVDTVPTPLEPAHWLRVLSPSPDSDSYLSFAAPNESVEKGMRKLDRHFGYYQCSLCGKKKGALYGETGTIGSNCANVLRHTAGESHLRAWLADLPVEAEKPTLAELQTSIAHKWLGSERSKRTTQTKVRVQRKAQKEATNAAVDAAVAAGRAVAG